MKISYNLIIGILCLFLFSFYSCTSTTKTDGTSSSVTNQDSLTIKFTVEEASEWNALFTRSSGWFGGDGIFAIPLNAKDNVTAKDSTKTMLIFSDSLIGEIANNTLPNGFNMVNNSVAYLTGNEPQKDKISFHWAKDESSKPVAFFKPSTPDAEKGDYYWLGDGFVNTALNNTTYIFAYRMRNLDSKDDWSFVEMGTNLIAIPSGSKPPFKNQRQIQTPLRLKDGGFGAGIFVNTKESGVPNPDGYIYVYGVRGKKRNLMVSRVLPKDFENFTAWRFWDGTEWNSDINRVTNITNDVSNELSVTALPDGRYALVFQQGSVGSKVGLKIGLTPYSKFGPMMEVWDCKEVKQKNIFTYNAKAHPNLSKPGELLISYNVNAFHFHDEIKKSPHLYRPRFLRLKFQNE